MQNHNSALYYLLFLTYRYISHVLKAADSRNSKKTSNLIDQKFTNFKTLF